MYQRADNQTVATLGSHGTVTGWTSAITTGVPNDMFLKVTGAADMNISWSATLNIYEIKV